MPLSPEGRRLAAQWRLPEDAAGWPVIASPLSRTIETAEAMGLSPIPFAPLIEMDWGRLEGQSLAEIRAEGGAAFAANEATGLDFRPDGGETPRDVGERAVAGLLGLARSHVGVTHKGVLRALFARGLGWDMRGKAPIRIAEGTCHRFRLSPTGDLALVEANISLLRPNEPTPIPLLGRADAHSLARTSRRHDRNAVTASPASVSSTPGRVLFYVQHLYGIGHLKRASAIAYAMALDGLAVTVAHGGAPVPGMAWPGVDLVQLPSAAIRGGDFSKLIDETGRDGDDAWRARRAQALADLAERLQPDAVLFELFPFGRRQFRFELLPLIETLRARSPRPAILSSVRDILVRSPKPGREREAADLVGQAFDDVLVHGDPAFAPFEASFGEAARIAAKLRYTGYVSSDLSALEAKTPPHEPDGPGAGEIVISAGGGAAGGPLWAGLLAAHRLSEARRLPWRLIAGPRLGEAAYEALVAQAEVAAAEPGSGPISVERFRSDFPAVLRRAALSISQGGYNTTIDLLATGVPAIVVPIGEEEETEQTERAQRLADRGYLRLFAESDLRDPRAFAAAIDAALADGPRRRAMPPAAFALQGARTSAGIVAEHIRRVRGG